MRAQYLESLSLNCEQSFPRFSTHTMHKCVCLLQQFYIYFPIEHAKCCMAYAIQTGRYVVFFFCFYSSCLYLQPSLSLWSPRHTSCHAPIHSCVASSFFGSVQSHTHTLFSPPHGWAKRKGEKKDLKLSARFRHYN